MKTQVQSPPGENTQPTKRTMSAEARRKIGLAQKARHRKAKAGAAPQTTNQVPTRAPQTYGQAVTNLLLICGQYNSTDQIQKETEAFLTTQTTLAGQHLVGLLGTIAEVWSNQITQQSRPRTMTAGH